MITSQVSCYTEKFIIYRLLKHQEKAKNSYLRYKIITSQTVSSEAQVKIFFIF